jgi:hypothetical protein
MSRRGVVDMYEYGKIHDGHIKTMSNELVLHKNELRHALARHAFTTHGSSGNEYGGTLEMPQLN